MPQAPDDVFDTDDGVVHERPHGDGETAQSHRVERAAGQRDHQETGHHRQGNRHGRDERRAQVAEEHEQNQDHENAALTERGRDVAHGGLDEIRLAEVLLLDHDPGRERRRQVLEHPVDLPRQLEGVGARLLLDAQDDRGAGAVGRRAALRLGAHADTAEVADLERDPVAHPHDRRRQIFRPARPAQAPHQVLLAAVDVEAGGRIAARAAQGAGDLLQRDAVERQHRGIDLHLELPHVAADRHHLGDARDGEQPPPDDGLGQPA